MKGKEEWKKSCSPNCGTRVDIYLDMSIEELDIHILEIWKTNEASLLFNRSQATIPSRWQLRGCMASQPRLCHYSFTCLWRLFAWMSQPKELQLYWVITCTKYLIFFWWGRKNCRRTYIPSSSKTTGNSGHYLQHYGRGYIDGYYRSPLFRPWWEWKKGGQSTTITAGLIFLQYLSYPNCRSACSEEHW